MIFVDANVFLRYLVRPVTPQDEQNLRYAAGLFRRLADGTVEVTTSEAILAEVVYILSTSQHYGAPRQVVVDGLKPLLSSSRFKLPRKEVCLRALEVWLATPKLSFPDAIAAAYSEQLGYELATFDQALARIPEITRYRFS